jgi:hypothetical protein
MMNRGKNRKKKRILMTILKIKRRETKRDGAGVAR